MMTVEVKINDKVIGRVKAVNVGGNMNGVCAYRCEGEIDTVRGFVHKEFEIRHDRNEGAWALTERLAQEMQK